MRVRRRRRRILGAALGLAYLAVLTWLVSPLWRPADAATVKRTPVRQVRSDGPIGLAPLAASKPLPATLPGATPPAASSETGTTETTSEGEVEGEATASAPEVSEESASPPPSPEPSAPASSEVIGGEG